MSLSHRRLSIWYQQLAQQLEAGVPLAEALRAAIADVMTGVEPDLDYVRKVTAPFGWESIFGRIEAVYRQAMEDRRRTTDESRSRRCRRGA